MNVDIKTLFVEERATFERHRKAWAREGKTGQWAVVLGREVLGLYESSGAAWRAGIEHHGRPGFMLKQIFADDRFPRRTRGRRGKSSGQS